MNGASSGKVRQLSTASNRVMCHDHGDQVERCTWGLWRESWPRASTVVVSKHGIANRMEC